MWFNYSFQSQNQYASPCHSSPGFLAIVFRPFRSILDLAVAGVPTYSLLKLFAFIAILPMFLPLAHPSFS